MAQTGMMMPAVFGPAQAALTKLRAIAMSNTMLPVALQPEHAVFHRAMTGIALPVAFEPAHAVISEPWATAMTDTAMSDLRSSSLYTLPNKLRARATTGTKMPVVAELAYATLFKLWATAKSGTAKPVIFGAELCKELRAAMT